MARRLPSGGPDARSGSACKPGSVPRAGCPARGESHSSRPTIARRLEHSHPDTATTLARRRSSGPLWRCPYSSLLREGLASPPVTRLSRVGSYPTISPLPDRAALASGAPSAVSFLWRFPSGHPGSVLPTSLSCGARTFLPPASGLSRPQADGCPAHSPLRNAKPSRAAAEMRGEGRQPRIARMTRMARMLFIRVDPCHPWFKLFFKERSLLSSIARPLVADRRRSPVLVRSRPAVSPSSQVPSPRSPSSQAPS